MPLLFHAFSTPKNFYVFDANTNSVYAVDRQQHKALSEIEQGQDTEENLSILHKFQKKGVCCEANIENIRHPDTDILFTYLKRKIYQVTLQVTQRCNLRCEYCAYSGQYEQRSHSTKSMSFDTARKAIDMVLKHSEDNQKFSIGFYGGEPLLELSLIKKCVDYVNQQAPDRNISYTITTNGTLLTVDTYKYLVDNGFKIAISLDGPKQVHDRFRKFLDGKGSFDIIIRNINAIQHIDSESKDNLLINAVVSPETDDSCLPTLFKLNEVMDYYNVGMSFVSDTYSKEIPQYTDRFNIQYGHEMCKLFLHMVGRLDKEHISSLLIQFEGSYKNEYRLLKRIEKLPPICHPGGPCLAGVTRLFIDIDGNFFPCERVSENSEIMAIGDLDNGFDIEKAKALLNTGQVTADRCKKCWAIAHCTMCAAYADNLSGFSKSARLSNCNNVRFRYETTLKELCFLKEAGYSFEEDFRK